MKINAKTAWLPIIITIIYTILLSTSIVLRLGNSMPTNLMQVAIEITYTLTIAYSILVLKHIKEKRLTVAIYSLYLVFDIGFVLYQFLSSPGPNQFIVFLILGALSAAITNILIILAFNFKTRQLVVPFCVYGFIFLLITFFKLVGSVFIMMKYGDTLFNYTIPAEIFLPIAMFYLFFRIKKYLKSIEASQA
jgi:hypothetical protein